MGIIDDARCPAVVRKPAASGAVSKRALQVSGLPVLCMLKVPNVTFPLWLSVQVAGSVLDVLL